nr:VWA domain-containing protein [Roseospira visakhapatnamensis]
MARADASVPTPAPSSDTDAVAAFLGAVQATAGAGHGRLIFALDATASRQPTWDLAMDTQATMFATATRVGGLSVQLVFYRGLGQCRAGPWVTRADDMMDRMSKVTCRAGRTQIGRVLRHALATHAETPVSALVFIGDSMEEEPDTLYALAGDMGLRKLPVFVFHEGGEPVAARVLAHVARLSGGAFCPFDAASADQLRRLLESVAIYAAAGRAALEDHARRAGGAARRLTSQLARDSGDGGA